MLEAIKIRSYKRLRDESAARIATRMDLFHGAEFTALELTPIGN